MVFPPRIIVRRRLLLITVIFVALIWVSFLTSATPQRQLSSAWMPSIPSFLPPWNFASGQGGRMPLRKPLPPLAARVPCRGPRGKLLSHSPDDELHAANLSAHEYPPPFVGSHEALGLEQTWMTADDRYGPYGFGERLDSYTRSRVDWDAIDWNQLQNECFQRNAGRFPPAAAPFESMPVRFGLRNKQKERRMTPKWDRFRHTRRTAVVVRAWDGFDYKDEDLFYLRSLIVETSLRTGGEYHVVLLVNIKDPAHNIFASQRAYNKAFRNAGIPPELQSIAVLWDDNLLESWYPLIGEHRTMWQVYQPMQLFALFYPQFDHYWQLELDMRFTGDAGAFLDALSTFARNEPRKQALERATFQHLPTLIGPYSNLAAAVDKVNGGDAHVWGPMPNPAIEPIGPVPPFPTARDDVDFSWGVGEDADALVTSFCANVTASLAWQFRDWVGGMGVEGDEAPRFFSPPAVQRASRTLLLAIHEAQVDMGARVPSEATLPTFALWHGLKLSYAPHPVYWHHPDDTATAEAWWKGGPEESPDGIGPTDPTDHPKGMGLTFWWESHWPRLLVDVWMDVGPNPKEDEYPWLARTEADQVYLPNMMLHPMKHRE